VKLTSKVHFLGHFEQKIIALKNSFLIQPETIESPKRTTEGEKVQNKKV
jgi:hypothetical protein